MTRAWVEHLVDYNWSHVRQSIDEGERAMAAGAPMATVDDVMAQPGPGDGHGQQRTGSCRAGRRGGDRRDRHAAAGDQGDPGAAAGALNPRNPDEAAAGPSVLTVRIGELSAERIERAGAAGQTLALTHDRELVAIVIPVTRGLVEFLIEQNMSRVLYNTALGEKEIWTPEKMITLDEALDQAAAAPPPGPL